MQGMRSRLTRGRAAAAGVIVTIGVACSSREGGFDGPPGDFGRQDPAEAGSDACEGLRCSRDLKKVLSSCDDRVIEECGPGQGCGEGACVDGCTAAALSKGSAGCSFWTLPPDSATEGQQGSCYAALLANTWEQPVTISAAHGADALDITRSTFLLEGAGTGVTYTRLEGALAPGQVAIVFLAGTPNAKYPCPAAVEPAVKEDPILHGTARTKAFRLMTSAPVSAYSIFPYGGAGSQIPAATLLLPVTSWSTNYLAVSPMPGFEAKDIAGQYRRRTSLQLVADEDETEIRILPKADISDGIGLTGSARGAAATWTLGRGEVVQITQLDELTGSAVVSNKPIGMFGGAECHNIPTTMSFCDALHQQIPPLSSWGSEYALVPYRPRVSAGLEKAVPWRFVGAVDGTVLNYDPERPPEAPVTLAAGEVATFMTNRIVSVKSQDAEHPFYAAVYMTGSMYNSTSGIPGRTLGDPDYVNVVPSDQFLDRYVFFTDHTYSTTTLTIVRRRTPSGFLPVELGCAGAVGDFKPVGENGDYEYAWVTLTDHFQPQRFDGGECGYGRHEAKSEGSFSLTVWGIDLDASYGYPGGMGLRPITTIEAPVPR